MEKVSESPGPYTPGSHLFPIGRHSRRVMRSNSLRDYDALVNDRDLTASLPLSVLPVLLSARNTYACSRVRASLLPCEHERVVGRQDPRFRMCPMFRADDEFLVKYIS